MNAFEDLSDTKTQTESYTAATILPFVAALTHSIQIAQVIHQECVLACMWLANAASCRMPNIAAKLEPSSTFFCHMSQRSLAVPSVSTCCPHSNEWHGRILTLRANISVNASWRFRLSWLFWDICGANGLWMQFLLMGLVKNLNVHLFICYPAAGCILKCMFMVLQMSAVCPDW